MLEGGADATRSSDLDPASAGDEVIVPSISKRNAVGDARRSRMRNARKQDDIPFAAHDAGLREGFCNQLRSRFRSMARQGQDMHHALLCPCVLLDMPKSRSQCHRLPSLDSPASTAESRASRSIVSMAGRDHLDTRDSCRIECPRRPHGARQDLARNDGGEPT